MPSEKVTTDFPTMGQNPMEGSIVNLSGARSPYTKLVVKAGSGKSDAPDSGTGHRSQVQVGSEVNGPCCAPVTTLYGQNAAEAENTQRNVKIMPSKAGVSDFWAGRAEGPVIG